MTGADFTDIGLFSNALHFEKTLLKYASFACIRIRKNHFIDCDLGETYFQGADIALSVFDNCDLKKAIFTVPIWKKWIFQAHSISRSIPTLPD